MLRLQEGNVNIVVFEDEITLYWDKQWELSDGVIYRIYLDGKNIATTDKTHYEITGLEADKAYAVAVEGHSGESVFCGTLRTEKIKKRIDVTKPPYNAVGDGKTVNTVSIQKALDNCKSDEVIYFPNGIYMTGALDMKSNTELRLEREAVIQGTGNVEDYAPKVLSRFEGREMECYRPLINIGKMDKNGGYTTENVVIRGGAVYGGGKELCWSVIDLEKERLKDFLKENADYVKTCENENTIPGRARPRLINMNNAKNVVFANCNIGFGAAWNVHFVYCKDVLTYNCTIKSRGVWNGDGWNPDSSENCTIFGTRFDTHDDAIAIKSGKNPEGNVINRPTRGIRIFDCGGCNGVACGSELSGGISEVYIWDCDFDKGGGGFRVKSTRKRGGFVKNVKIRNCKLIDIRLWTGYTCNDDGEGAGVLTDIENFDIKNVEIHGVSYRPEQPIIEVVPIMIWGFDEPERYIRNVTIDGVRLPSSDDGLQRIEIKNAANVSINNITYYEIERRVEGKFKKEYDFKFKK